ncbi:MAG: hypothetical protein M1818_008325 [Claussenomyces sp. TS43310]|nr:MAG: hypothetical protein M1818_008325 [Claussenomyces sp. TS43310]
MAVFAQSSTSSVSDRSRVSISSSSSSGLSELATPTGSYLYYTSQITLTETGTYGTITFTSSTIGSHNISSTASQSAVKTAVNSLTALQGIGPSETSTRPASNSTATRNSTASSTSSASIQPTNTTPCNGHPEFCVRQFGNITNVMSHNSPFVQAGSLAANQLLDVTTQLNDGVRGLQTQTHAVNGTMYNCHTSCQLLNAGTLTSFLATVTQWVRQHPYDVLTIIIENGDYVAVEEYVEPITASGILQYVYSPPKVPMGLSDWPTLAEMILHGQRVVLFLDYNANQTSVPWLLDEFSQAWETPFDPTDQNFPCNVQRPPKLSDADAKARLYLTNHNLNTEISLLGNSLSVPSVPLLNVTNAPAYAGFGSLGVGIETCFNDWGRPPNFLNVDYYNMGSFNGSVFQVAADWNNVTYNNASCCGITRVSGAHRIRTSLGRETVVMVMLAILTSGLLI